MKSKLQVGYNIIRYIIALSAVWLLVDTVYLKLTGDYILYYNTLLHVAENAIEEMLIIDEVFNIRQDQLAIFFSDYYSPVIRAGSVIVVTLNTLAISRGDGFATDRKRAIAYAIDLISMLVILCITLGIVPVI